MVSATVLEVPDDGDFSRFNISSKLIERLHAKNIQRLFPVQSRTFELICSGSDVVVTARTGTGKTLAFALPIIHSLLISRSNNQQSGRHPTVLVLAPTRELAVQISSEFTSICGNDFVTLVVFGGVPIGPQRQSLRHGVDVLIATPGRTIDLIERGALSLNSIRYVVLDEVDRMLDMGFAKDVESIIAKLYEDKPKNLNSRPQTLLFSATLPRWISSVASKYLDENTRYVSLIEKQDNKTALNVTHLALPCPFQERPATLADVIRTYCKRRESRCIVFCERKRDADELAAHSAMSADCHVLHGDVPQDKRGFILEKFREGKYRTLVTTNVAARGLDIPEVDLVIQCHPPRDIEDYIHRSGRTGRAERSGTSVVFYSPNERSLLTMIEMKAGIQFRRISAPTLQDIVDSWGVELVDAFTSIPEATWSAFIPTARQLIRALRSGGELTSTGIKKHQNDQPDIKSAGSVKPSKSTLLLRTLCCSLAHFSGNNGALEPRSLLTARRGWTTYRLQLSQVAERKGFAYAELRQQIANDVIESIKNMSFTKERTGFVFDVPANLNDTITSSWRNSDSASLEVLTELPELEPESGDMSSSSFHAGHNNFRNFQVNRRGRNFLPIHSRLSFSSNADGENKRSFPFTNGFTATAKRGKHHVFDE